MNVQFRNEDGLISPALQERIEKKLTKLSLLTDTDKESAVAVFDLEKTVGSRQSGDLWKASITLTVEGKQYYAAELADSPEKASDIALNEVRTEVRKAQGKKRTLVRKGGGLFKSITQRLTRS